MFIHTEEALSHITTTKTEAVLVFVTRGMLDVAQDVGIEFPDLRVVLLSDAPPRSSAIEGGVVLIDKLALIHPEGIPRLILGEESAAEDEEDTEDSRR